MFIFIYATELGWGWGVGVEGEPKKTQTMTKTQIKTKTQEVYLARISAVVLTGPECTIKCELLTRNLMLGIGGGQQDLLCLAAHMHALTPALL